MRKLFATTALTSLSLCAIPALAQETAQTGADGASTGSGIGEIVVTAQKRAENIQNVPIAISAVSSQFLETRGITSIDTLGSIAPNVKIERAPSNKTISQISIRGSVTINPAVTWEPAVGLYLNGVYIAKAQGSIFDVADLERVEILRGPQGTLYGRNALAGAVNLVPKMPSGKLGLKAEATYGNYTTGRARWYSICPLSARFR
ncbi:TonB-dependent receptor [Novosphingobium sp. FKTRR1]|uniref:TonB-dependent receptor plug domain-containing protein n=1 Tax=Novosphingobium sp. FKTRR1 TaxID=2879118 RepID=UPI001CEFE3D4|nr:TonB-dependent receptor [Novosphingobium sp. FKTRR1]